MEILEGKITINGLIQPGAGGAFKEVEEDVSNFVDLRRHLIMVVDNIEYLHCTLDDTPADTAVEYSMIQLTHNSQIDAINHDSEDLLYRGHVEEIGKGVAGNSLLIPLTSKQPIVRFPEIYDKPLIFHKKLYIGTKNTNSGARGIYYRISCRQARITETELQALIADISEDL